MKDELTFKSKSGKVWRLILIGGNEGKTWYVMADRQGNWIDMTPRTHTGSYFK